MPPLNRAIGPTALVLLIINSIIGAGIFGLPAKVYALAGNDSLLAFLLCALLVLVYVFCFAEVSTQFAQTGGPYRYIHQSFGPLPGFFMGWLLLLSRIFNYAVLLNLLITYAASFFPALGSGSYRLFAMFLVSAVLLAINHRGVKGAARASSVITVAKLIPLALFVVGGLFFLQKTPPLPPPSAASFSEAVLLLVFAFGGFESALVNSGEIKAPEKNLPFGLIAGLAVVTIFYCGIQVVCMGTLPTLATSATPIADAAQGLWGTAGRAFIVAGALVSIVGTLHVLLLSGSRLPFAFAEAGQMPSYFARVHPRYATPTPALVAVALLCLAVSVLWQFLPALTIAVVIRVLVYAFVCAALLKLRGQNKQRTPTHYQVRGGKALAVLGLLIACWLLSASSVKELRTVGYCLLVGAVVYAAQKARRQTTHRT